MNELIRAVTLDDIDPLMEMISSVTPGLTTLLLDRERLLERVERSHFAFNRQSESHAGEPYLLVMEQSDTGRLIGTATVYGKSGGYQPIYVYRVVTTTHDCPQLDIRGQQRQTLHLERVYDGPTEIGSLFLLPQWRGGGRGRFLSLARFMLFAQRPAQFADRVIAEMRGQCDQVGVSPFWEALMRPFFQVDFPVADALSTQNKTFIEELVPPFPIPLELLDPSARAVIGKVHPETEPAVKLLADQGFAATDCVDIFDGGPVMQCQTVDIATVKTCRSAVVHVVADSEACDQPKWLIAARSGGFRCVLASARFSVQRTEPPQTDEKSRIDLNESVAQRLGVNDGDSVFASPWKHGG